MGIITLYFVLFIIIMLNDIFGNLSNAEVEIFREIFSWTNVLIASVGYGICKRLDEIIKKIK